MAFAQAGSAQVRAASGLLAETEQALAAKEQPGLGPGLASRGQESPERAEKAEASVAQEQEKAAPGRTAREQEPRDSQAVLESQEQEIGRAHV